MQPLFGARTPPCHCQGVPSNGPPIVCTYGDACLLEHCFSSPLHRGRSSPGGLHHMLSGPGTIRHAPLPSRDRSSARDLRSTGGHRCCRHPPARLAATCSCRGGARRWCR
eukprot:scaffold482_cov247-Pinguiococcus_pyrenoidosus.AAC.6